MNIKQKRLIVSMIIGDGYIDKNNYLSIQHCGKQKPYLDHKKQLLETHNLKVSKIYDVSRKYKAFRFNCVEPEYIKILKRHFYPNGNKTISRHLLNHLDEEGLAIWFMDDGSCIKRYRNGYGNGRYLQLCTNSFDEWEHKVIHNYFMVVWGVTPTIKESKRSDRKLSYHIRFYGDDARRFIKIISPYVIDSMKYKIDFEYKTVSSKETPTSNEGGMV